MYSKIQVKSFNTSISFVSYSVNANIVLYISNGSSISPSSETKHTQILNLNYILNALYSNLYCLYIILLRSKLSQASLG